MEKYSLIAHEWDNIAEQRLKDLTAGIDKSYSELLIPNMLDCLKNCNLEFTLDLGCGVGVFTRAVAEFAGKILAIDLSCKSIELAKSQSQAANIEYRCQNFLDLEVAGMFTTIFSNMSLMTTPDLIAIIRRASHLLTINGSFLFCITHPSFWPIYWNYANDKFDYASETEIVREFRITNKVYGSLQTRHYHRPISYYINLIISSGFRLKEFRELKDQDNRFWYPRFLLIECIKPASI